MYKLKMDEIKDDFKIYKNIFTSSAALMIFIVQAYVILIMNDVDLVGFEFINNNALRLVLQVVIQLIGFSFINIIIFCICYKFHQNRWIKKNKKIWFQGEWLHIHDKKNVRIGILTIKQRFSALEVKGAKNITPNVNGIENKPATSWNYISSTIDPEEMLGVKLLCSYIASNARKYKQGLHAFEEIQTGKDEFPYKMSGFFNDTLEGSEGNIQDASDNEGKIYLFKLTPELKKYICHGGSADMNALANILENPNLKTEEYCILLKEIIRKYGYSLGSESATSSM